MKNKFKFQTGNKIASNNSKPKVVTDVMSDWKDQTIVNDGWGSNEAAMQSDKPWDDNDNWQATEHINKPLKQGLQSQVNLKPNVYSNLKNLATIFMNKGGKFNFKRKYAQGGTTAAKAMVLLDHNGQPQMEMQGGEIVFSKKSTKQIIDLASKGNSEKELHALGEAVYKERMAQRKRDGK